MATRTLANGPEITWDESVSGSLIGRRRNNHVVVRSVEDLPTVTNGEHVLAENTYYEFNGNVVINSPLRISSGTALGGAHLSQDVIVYTGTAAAIKSTNVGFEIKYCTVIAPNGSLLDLTGGITDEFVAEWVGLYNCLSIGTVTGFRVPTFKNCAAENFADGITFTGTSNKIFVDASPFRNAGENAVAIYFDENCVTRAIDIGGNYFKEFQSGAVAISIHENATIETFGIITRNVFDTITTPLVGFGPASIEWAFSDNVGIRDSRVAAQAYLTNPATTVITTQDEYIPVVGGFTLVPVSERFSLNVNNELVYTGRENKLVTFNASFTINPDNNDRIGFRVGVNGTLLDRSAVVVEQGAGPGSSPRVGSVIALFEVKEGDTVSLYVANLSGDGDIPWLTSTYAVNA